MKPLFKTLQLLLMCAAFISTLSAQTPTLLTSTSVNLQRKAPSASNWTFFKTYTINTYSDGTIDPSEDILTLFDGSDYLWQMTVKYKGSTVVPTSSAFKFSAKIGGIPITISAKPRFYEMTYSANPFKTPHSTILMLSLKPGQQKEVLMPIFMKIVDPPAGEIVSRSFPVILSFPPYVHLTVSGVNRSFSQKYEPELLDEQIVTLRGGNDYLLQLDIEESDFFNPDEKGKIMKRWNQRSDYQVTKVLGESALVRLENHPASNRAFYLRISKNLAPGRSIILPLAITLSKPGQDSKTFNYQIIIQN